MIQYLYSRSDKKKVKVRQKLVTGSWVRVEKPTPEELAELVNNYRLDEAIIRDALDPHEVPRLEASQKTIYFITRLPDTEDDFNDFTTPIMFIVHPRYLFTISRDSLTRLWQPFIDRSTAATTAKTRLLIFMLQAVVQQYQSRVATINRQMRAATGDITRLRPKDIAVFVEYERKLNDYLDALIPSNDALEQLLKGSLLSLEEDDRNIVEDISIGFEQIIARCKSLLRTITNVRDSFRTVMDTRLNETIRLLTVITLALTIPTMLAGLYGMNVDLPGNENSPLMFWVIAAISFGTSGAMAFYFLFKRR